MDAEAEGWTRLDHAHAEPWAVARSWRAGGGRVVGMFGRCAPRELVLAAEMLPVRLWPGRLLQAGAGEAAASAEDVPAGLRAELSEESVQLLAALLGGHLDWVDALLIGRDTESHTKLFYVIRELAQDPEFGSRIPPFAFSDVLRLPLRTSAVYSRTRLRQLAAVLGGWAGREVTEQSLAAVIRDELGLADRLRELDQLRTERRVTGSRVVMAARAAAVLPPADAATALSLCLQAAPDRPQDDGAPRIFLTGTEPEPALLSALEAAGLAVVGDDHGWYRDIARADGDLSPFDWLADRYQFSVVGPARAGLDRVPHTAAAARYAGADCILQLVPPDDVVSGWELAELRELVPALPIISIDPGSEPRDVVREVTGRLPAKDLTSPAAGAPAHG